VVVSGATGSDAQHQRAQRKHRHDSENARLHSVSEHRAHGETEAEEQQNDLADSDSCESAGPSLSALGALPREALHVQPAETRTSRGAHTVEGSIPVMHRQLGPNF
jgi:hypothetical protein